MRDHIASSSELGYNVRSRYRRTKPDTQDRARSFLSARAGFAALASLPAFLFLAYIALHFFGEIAVVGFRALTFEVLRTLKREWGGGFQFFFVLFQGARSCLQNMKQ
jgi:hypothetical protein